MQYVISRRQWKRERSFGKGKLGDGGLTCGAVETDDTVMVRFRPAAMDAKPAKPGVFLGVLDPDPSACGGAFPLFACCHTSQACFHQEILF